MIIRNQIDNDDALLGVVRAEGLSAAAVPEGFDAALASLTAARRAPLEAEEEAVRQAARNLLRNGRYRPTGRGKPASEYLVRAAQQEEAFPRINAPVDVNNYVSLKYLLPASLWDLDLAGTDTFVFRLGRPGEQYVFNAAGQVIDVEDLIVGCRAGPDGTEPIVNPVKDSLATKTTDRTTRVGACVYAPASVVPRSLLEAICDEFAGWLAACGNGVQVATGIVAPGEERVV